MRLTPWLLGTALALGCQGPHFPADEVLPPAPDGSVDWASVLREPRPIELVPLLTGEIKVNRGLLLDLEDAAIEDRVDRDVWVPVLGYLVRHAEHGSLLLDAGFDQTFSESGHGNFGGLARFVEITRQEPGRDTVSLLAAAGVAPDELRGVILSHLHMDHTAGLPDLPKTVPLYAGPGALDGYEPIWYAPTDHLAGFERIQTFSFEGRGEGGPGPAIDFFGDGSLFVVHTPGHLPGNVSFLVNGARGPTLLLCDASHTQEGFERGVGPGFVVDRAAATASLHRLRAFAQANPSVRVVAGHDASDWDMSRGIQTAR